MGIVGARIVVRLGIGMVRGQVGLGSANGILGVTADRVSGDLEFDASAELLESVFVILIID